MTKNYDSNENLDTRNEYIESLINYNNTNTDKPIHNKEIGQIEGKLLRILIRMNNVKTIVEIGTFHGYSTSWLAGALNQDGVVHTIEKDPTQIKIAQENLKDFKNINFICGDAIQELSKLQNFPSFCMVFIDANKSGYLQYLDWAEQNIKKNGLIVADNVLEFANVKIYQDAVKETEQLRIAREFNKRLSNSKNYESVIIPTTKGLMVAIKKF